MQDLSLLELDTAGIKAVASGSWPHLTRLSLSYATPDRLGFESLSCAPWKHLNSIVLLCVQIDAAAAAHLILADWPLLQELVVTHKYVQEAAYEVLGAQSVRYQLDRLEKELMLHQLPVNVHFPRRTDTAWPQLKHISVIAGTSFLKARTKTTCGLN